MGFSSEMHIEQHNLMMETDADYAQEYLEMAMRDEYEAAAYFAECAEFADQFPDYRISHTGYEEFDDHLLDAREVGFLEYDELF